MIHVPISITLEDGFPPDPFPPDDPPPPPPSAPEPYRILTVPDDGGRYMLLLDDWETARWGFMPRSRSLGYKKDPPWNALPATIPEEKLFYKLTKPWQLFQFELMLRSNGGYLPIGIMLDGYGKTYRDSGGMRDQHTYNNWRDDLMNVPHDEQKIFTDYVLGRNIPPEHTWGDAAQQDLLFSGNIVKVIGEHNDKWVIETLDPFKPPPSVDDVWGKWWLVGFLTLSAYNWDTGEKRRLKWPFFNGYGCPHMAIGRDGVNRVPKYWCRPIANGAEYSLYLP